MLQLSFRLMRHLFSPKQIIRSIILSQLMIEGSLHGYALTAMIEEKFGWKPSQTAIYNTLKALESDKFVTFDERTENGRNQKIYSITEYGQKELDQKKDDMFYNMSRRLSQMFSIMQDFSELHCLEEPTEEIKKMHVKKRMTGKKLDLIPAYVFKLMRVAPEETHQVLEEALKSLEKLAQTHKIDIHEFKKRLEQLQDES